MPATYVTRERGKITVKGKGEMVTFWLDSKSGRAPPSKDEVHTPNPYTLKTVKCLKLIEYLLKTLF